MDRGMVRVWPYVLGGSYCLATNRPAGLWGIHAVGTAWNGHTFAGPRAAETNLVKLIRYTCYTSGPVLRFFALARFLSRRCRSFEML